MTTRFTRVAGVAVAFGLAAALTACGSDSSDSGSTADDTAAAGGEAKKIALLLPENKTARYEAFDRPFFEEAVTAACADCEVIYSNAEQDAAKQQQQAEAAITQGVDVLVMSAVDGSARVPLEIAIGGGMAEVRERPVNGPEQASQAPQQVRGVRADAGKHRAGHPCQQPRQVRHAQRVGDRHDRRAI